MGVSDASILFDAPPKREDIKVGTELFLVKKRNKSVLKEKITITKVSRKLAYWGNGNDEKLSLETMLPVTIGFGHRNTLWDSEEAYDKYITETRIINACMDCFVSYNPMKRKKLTYEKAVKILAILNDEVQA